MTEDIDEQKRNYDSLLIENLIKTSEQVDRIISEAVDAGIESGRSIGVIESYNFLLNAGHIDAAELLMDLITEENEIRKSIADS